MKSALRTSMPIWVVLSLLLSLLPLSHSTQALAQPALAPAVDGKPSHGLSITLAPRQAETTIGQLATADLTILAERDTASFNLTLTSAGNVVINGPATRSLPSARKGQSFTEVVSYTVTGPDAGQITAVVQALKPAGDAFATSDAQIFFQAESGNVFYGTSGPLELKLKRTSRKHDAGQLNDDEYQDTIEQIFYGGAASSVTLGQPGGVAAQSSQEPDGSFSTLAASDLSISGTARWTDSAGGLHPIRSATVEIRDDELIGSDVIATVTTDASGNYSATVNNDDGIGQGGRDIFVRVLAQSPGSFVKSPPGFLGLGSEVYGIQSPVQDDVPDGAALTIPFTANNTDENNVAFSINDALLTANHYIERIRGSRFPDIDTVFPNGSTSAFFDGDKISLRLFDQFDWDVIHHEYGHYVQSRLNIANNPGGPHNIGDNLAEGSRGKDGGIRMAWAEGWPTYFGTALQQIMGTAAFGIPFVGDLEYRDSSSASSFSYSLETQVPWQSVGEDNELAVQRILWDLYDGADDTGDKGVAFGDASLWSTIDGSDAKTLFAGYQALTAGKPIKELANIGCIFSEHNVAPEPTAPADKAKAPKAPPAFSWTAHGGGPSNRNDQFIVEFYNHSFSTLLFATPEQPATSFTPTQAQWDDLIKRAGPVLNWVVKGRQTNAPVTGPYTSCARSMVPPKLDLVFVIDTTGSMWDDIASVKASASSIVDTLATSGTDYRVGLVNFKDHPVSPYGDPGDYPARIDLNFSTDKAAIISAINTLSASGGNDWPEAVHSGSMTAIGFPWREDANKAIIIMGDAPPHDPEPFTGHTMASVLQAANNAGVGFTPAATLSTSSAETTSAAAEATAIGGGVKIYPILVGFDYSAQVAFQQYADGTGGQLFAASNAAAVVPAILAALDALLDAPVAEAGGPYTGLVGQTITFDGSGSFDPDGSIVRYEWDFQSDGIFDASGASPTASFSYAAPFVGAVTLRVTDNDNRTTTDVAPIEIYTSGGGGGLTLGSITAPNEPIVANTTNEASATFTDPGGAGPHTATWNWGDGSTSAGTVNEATGRVTGTHAYTTPGVYELSLTVTNRNGISATSTFRYIVVYDPTAGFVTGGGWITSPAGAYAPDPSLTGKANFGFVAKYQRGATIPTGNTEFQFKTAALDFASTSYEWLVVSGGKAQYKGVGTVNGAGTYGFMLTAIDGATKGKADTFRIKIWNKNTGAVVYDNQMGASDTADPSTTLGGGSIVIHTQGGQ